MFSDSPDGRRQGATFRLVERLHADGLAPRAISKVSGLSTGEVFNALGALGVSKKSIHLPQAFSAWEEAVLLGSLLGDGHLHYRHQGHGNPHFVLSHAEKQCDYLQWKVEQLGDLFLQPSFNVHADSEGHRSVHATSRCTSLLVEFYRLFYGTTSTKKTITDEVLKRVAEHDFRDAILAVWFGDDGYRTSGNGKSVGFVFGNLGSEEAYERVASWFGELGYEGVLHQHCGHRTYRYFLLRVRAAHQLRDAIGPYLPPSMQYKLDIGPPRNIRRSRGRKEG
jgi:hypothetical protein